jgi:hypothetical protein
MFRFLLLSGACLLLAGTLTVAGEPAIKKTTHATRKYTKEWTDDYHNFHKDVYQAYETLLKDEQGREIWSEVKHGLATSYYRNGKKAWQGEFRDGQREGEYTTWSENGTKTSEMRFENGLVHGKTTQWSSAGLKMCEETYVRGKAEGETRWWDADGKLVAAGINRGGKPWSGTFPEMVPLSTPDHHVIRHEWMIRRYADGKKVSEEKLTGRWWW